MGAPGVYCQERSIEIHVIAMGHKKSPPDLQALYPPLEGIAVYTHRTDIRCLVKKAPYHKKLPHMTEKQCINR